LTSPVYYSNGTTFYASPSQQIDNGTTIEASFGADPKQYCFEGAILYKLQRKHTTRIDNQLNSNTTFIEEMATNVHLLVVWDVEYNNRKFRVWLIEYADKFIWDEVKLLGLYKKYNEQFFDYIPDITTWLIYDDAVMKTKLDVTYGSDYKLDITISEETGSYNVERPIEVDPKRLVLSLSMTIVLMYAVSIRIQPTFKLNIHNRCLSVDLVSPVYITNNMLECYRPPNPKVCVGSVMGSCFTVLSRKTESHGALIYRLQRKQPHESTEINKSISSAVHILITWKLFEFKTLYADLLLIEHEKGFGKVNLKKLRHENVSRFRMCSDFAAEMWSLDDNTALMTKFEVMNKGRLLNVSILEVGRDNGARSIAHISPER
jgi:hypothetical protein